MGLIGNYTFAHKSPARRMAGTGAGLRSGFNDPGRSRGMFAGQAAVSKLSSIPRGYSPCCGSWIAAYTAGDLSSVNEGDFAVTGGDLTLAAGRNLVGESTVTITIPDAALQLVVSATGEATITWSGDGILAGALSATGETSLTFTAGPSLLGAIADLTATGSVTLTGSAAVTAIGALSGDITPFTELSPENLANSVWQRVIEGGYTAEEMIRIITAVQAGNATDLDGNASFFGIDGSTTRIAGNRSGGTRTITTRNGS